MTALEHRSSVTDRLFGLAANARNRHRSVKLFRIGQQEWRELKRYAELGWQMPPSDLKVWGIPTEVSDAPAGIGVVEVESKA